MFALSRPWTTSDTPKYLELARRLGEGSYTTLIQGISVPQTVRPPGYPLFLGMITAFGRLPSIVGVVANFALYVGALYLVSRLLRAHGRPVWPFLLLLVFYPFAAAYSSFLMSEALALFLVCALALLLGRPNLPSRRDLILSGLALGFLALTRSDTILLIVLLPLVLAYRFRRESVPRSTWERRGIANAALVGALALLVLAPYALWNWQQFGRFAPLPVSGAVPHSLFMASWQSQLSEDDVVLSTGGKFSPRADAVGFTRAVENANREIGVKPRTPVNDPTNYAGPQTQQRAARVLMRAAIERIRERPGDYTQHVAGNVWQLWNTSRYPARVPVAAQWVLRVLSGIVFALGLAGGAWFLFSRAAPPGLKVPALMLLYVPAVHLWLHTEARYTAAVRPLLLLFASVVLIAIVQRFSSARAARRSASST
jgi:hypothetical protein